MYKLINYYVQRFSFPHRGWKYFHRLLRWLDADHKEYRKKIFNGFYMLVTPSEHIQQQLFWYGYYEKPVAELMMKVIKTESVVLDIGANIGYFTLVAASIATNGRVHAFEPVIELFQRLQKNVDGNKLLNVTAVNVAVGKSTQDSWIFIADEINRGMSSLRLPENFSGTKQPVHVISVDDWVEAHGVDKIDVVKLDVEGSELFALQGMKRSLMNFKPILIVEINANTLAYFGLAPANVISFLSELGYSCFNVDQKGRLQKTNNSNWTENVAFIHDDKAEQFHSYLEK